MEVDFFDFITRGVLGQLIVGTPWHQVVKMLGQPELYEEPSSSSPGFARYGDIEFIIQDGKVAVISMQLDGADIRIPSSIQMVNFDDPNPDADEVAALLQDQGISWERMELLCDEWQDYYRTERGVHLSFGGELLAKVGATDPVTQWGV
jgi:hypothetical protein